MIDDRLQRTETHVRSATDLPEENKSQILGLLAQLKSRIGKLSETHEEEADRIARMVETSTEEATRTGEKPGLLQTALHGLQRSVEGFESSHPELVETVNEFATSLANMGL